jgi:hypothetical protein
MITLTNCNINQTIILTEQTQWLDECKKPLDVLENVDHINQLITISE